MKNRRNAIRVLQNGYGKLPVSEAVQVLLDTVFPRRCPVCDDAVAPFGSDVCDTCKTAIRPLSAHLCMKCGRELPPAERDAEYCRGCRKTSHAFHSAYAVFPYRAAAPSIYRFKYMGRREYASFYARRFVERYGGLPPGVRIDALVPVPMHRAKKRRRGYNQAEAFARALSVYLKTPVINDLVLRVRDTKPQKLLDYQRRRNNLKNAFIMSRDDVKYISVALVDDIYTTGSTADEIAALLKRNGVKNVYVFTVAAASS